MTETSTKTDFTKLNGPTFTWEIWYACNYRCTYCPWEMTKSWEKMSKMHSGIQPSDWLAAWDRMHAKYGSSHLYLIGGEPILYPKIDEILEVLARKHYLSVITNLSLSLDAARRLSRELPPDRVRFGASFHPEFSNLDEFVEKLVIFKDAGFQVWISIVAWPPFVDKLQFYKETFERRGIYPDVHTFFGDYEGKSYPAAYTAEQKAAISPHLNEVLITHGLEQESTLGKPCVSGYLSAKVLGNGDVYRCGSLVNYDTPAPMGNILKPDFELWAAPTPCPRPTCNCGDSRLLLENYVKEHPLAAALRSSPPAP